MNQCCVKLKGGKGYCNKSIFVVKGQNKNKCKSHYLVHIHNQNNINDITESPKESINKVIEGVYIGSIQGAKNIDLLKKLGIKSIFNVSGIEPLAETQKGYRDLGIKYKTVTKYSDGRENFFIDCPFGKYANTSKLDFFNYILNGVKAMQLLPQPILVHCFAGMNRSAAVIAAYLILVKGFSYAKALQTLTKTNNKRGLQVLTNPCFRKALEELNENKHLLNSK